jgi:hypothetical protein
MSLEHPSNEVLFVIPVTKKLSSLSYNAKGIHLRLVALIPAYGIPKDATFIITKKLKALLYTPVKSFTKDGKRFNQTTSSTKSGNREYNHSEILL